MNNKYPYIFTPLKVGNTVFKNRIFTAPANGQRQQAVETNYPTPELIAYYAEKAKGGSASIAISSTLIGRIRPEDPVHCDLDITKGHLRDWTELVNQIHFYGAKCSMELMAFDIYDYDETGKMITYSPSGDTDAETGNWMPAITKDAMERFAEDYADAAECVLKAGFDGIFLHGGHGVFLSRFISPYFNKRTDEFGGSMDNRAKFPLMVLNKIRERVGNKLYIEYRISGSELISDGFQINDCIEFLKLIQDKIDIAQISVGSMALKNEHIMHPTIFLEDGCNAYLARAVKEAGVKIPVGTLGKFQNPELIEQTLATGGADIVYMARGTIADPEVPLKAKFEKEDDIIPCVRCLHCLNYNNNKNFGCTVNPEVGRELSLKHLIPTVSDSMKIVIVGGGPAGLQAAITARKFGHDVTIIEKLDHLGGKLVFANYMPFKKDMKNFLDYLIRKVNENGVHILLNTTATPDLVRSLNPDKVIAAIGAHPIYPSIPGIKNAVSAEDYYNNPAGYLGHRVVVIGGGQVGCEIALHLAMEGREVTLVEMADTLATDCMHLTRAALMEKMDEFVTWHTKARCTGVELNGIRFVDEEGKEQFIEAEEIFLCAGSKEAVEEAEQFRDVAPWFRRIGDCDVASDVYHATQTGFDAIASAR